MYLLAVLWRGLDWAVRALERAHLAPSYLQDGLLAQNMPTGKHLRRILRCTLLPRNRTGESAVENEFIAKVKVHRELWSFPEVIQMLTCDLRGQLQKGR